MARERSVCPLSNEMLHRGALGQVPVCEVRSAENLK
jgi:hypothetical protein